MQGSSPEKQLLIRGEAFTWGRMDPRIHGYITSKWMHRNTAPGVAAMNTAYLEHQHII